MTTGFIIGLIIIALALAWVLERKFDEAGRLKRDNEALRRERSDHEQALAKFQETLAKIEKDNRQVDEMVTRMREQRDTAQAYAREVAAKRAVAWPKPERRMTEREVLGQFDVEMGDPFWTALHQELDDAIGDQLDLVTQAPGASLTAEQRVHIAGMAESLRAFQRRLLDRQAAATRAEADDDDKKEAA
jgi:uncharacterized coiled-coil protein SlyX